MMEVLKKFSLQECYEKLKKHDFKRYRLAAELGITERTNSKLIQLMIGEGMKLPKICNNHWTIEQEDYLRERWKLDPLPTIAKDLQRTQDGVFRKGRDLGLHRE